MSNDQWPMTKTTLFGRVWVLLGLLAVGLVISACGTTLAFEQPGPEASPVAVPEIDDPTFVPLTETVEPTAPDTLRPTSDASSTMPTPIPGVQMAPDFSLPDLEGQMWTLSQFRSQPVMLFMWATW